MISAPDQPPACPDPTPRESHLLAAYLATGFDLTKLAQQESLSPAELLAFTQSDSLQTQVTALRALIEQSLSLRALQSRFAAINALEHVANTTTNLKEKRLAATQLLRGPTSETRSQVGRNSATPSSNHTSSPRTNSANTAASTPDLPRESKRTTTPPNAAPAVANSPSPPITTSPVPPITPSSPPDTIAESIRDALRDLKSRDNAATLLGFSTRNTKFLDQPLPKNPADIIDFIRAAALDPALEAAFQDPSGPTSPTTASYTISLKHQNRPNSKYHLKLAKNDNALWHIERLNAIPDSS